MTSHPVVAITGANGYVGTCIAAALQDMTVIRLVRRRAQPGDIAWSFDSEPREVAEILASRNVTHIIHVAWDMTSSRLADLKASCVQGSQRLIEAAKLAGVERLIFISTISAFAGARSAYGQAKLLVEKMVLDYGGVVIRLGLVYGDGDGGMFGNLQKTVRGAQVIPVIGSGTQPQYLLHEDTLDAAILAAVRGEFDHERQAITIANPQSVRFKDLLLNVACREGRRIVLVPIPWPALYAGLWMAERLGLRLKFRSDSVVSFIFQDPAPDFTSMRRHGIEPVPYRPEPGCGA